MTDVSTLFDRPSAVEQQPLSRLRSQSCPLEQVGTQMMAWLAARSQWRGPREIERVVKVSH